jgi:hypothetical protein
LTTCRQDVLCEALEALRKALGDASSHIQLTVVRALSEWPTDEPADDLLKVARESKSTKNQILALRGYVRLVGLNKDRPAEQTIKMYKHAMELAPGAGEKRMVLSGLADVKSLEALQMAARHLEDAALQAEAEAAVVKIAEATVKNNPEETKPVLEKVLRHTKSDSLRERAQELLNRAK